MGHGPGDDEGWRVMGRRTAWGRGAAVVALLCASAGPASWPAAAAPEAGPAGSSYAFAEDAVSVDGATGTADAQPLDAGKDYRSSLPRAAKLYYRLDLDDTSNAYVSVTAVPRAGGGKLSVSDGIRVSVQNADSHPCSYESANFGSSGSPRPLTAWGARTTSPPTPLCTGSGPYYVLVERVGTADSAVGTWDLELTTATEPALTRTGATSAPSAWDSASPEPLAGEARSRSGGAGFSKAAAIDQGVWRTGISPGQTLYYRVPVDWGRRLSATADLGGSGGGGAGYAVDALNMTLYNPVRAEVADADTGYDGTQVSASLAPLPAVAYANRYARNNTKVNGMRFAGSYYLAVHLSAGVADDFGDGPFDLTLRVRVSGTAQDGPGYAGQPVPGDLFTITAADRQAAAQGETGSDDTTMEALALGGLGTGTVVLVGLGVWTVVGRRGAGAV
ncbi:hypothetical protein [Streptomyces cylindrosporus]|uniref:Peptidase n=1 Tax=Streptomyces cylindrosporus TaxID=2927583 RepID=A0ABS9YBY4_9ACTN|nr:hypothetical protein [Streptomyces cylindrosporus]MCI3274738.1 hypothetical protein [Streptomyces cylindrosporus]